MIRCSCCKTYYTPEAFAALPLLGIQDDGVEALELRRCTGRRGPRPCASTLSRLVTP